MSMDCAIARLSEEEEEEGEEEEEHGSYCIHRMEEHTVIVMF